MAIDAEKIKQKLVDSFNKNAASHFTNEEEKEEVIAHIVRYPSSSLIPLMALLDRGYENSEELIGVIKDALEKGISGGAVFEKYGNGNDYSAIGKRSFDLAYKLGLAQMDNIEAKNALINAIGKAR